MRKIPFVSLEKAREIAEVIPTPFHLYDEDRAMMTYLTGLKERP